MHLFFDGGRMKVWEFRMKSVRTRQVRTLFLAVTKFSGVFQSTLPRGERQRDYRQTTRNRNPHHSIHSRKVCTCLFGAGALFFFQMCQIDVQIREVGDVICRQEDGAVTILVAGVLPADAARIADFLRMSPCLALPAVEGWLRSHSSEENLDSMEMK
jgi:hypothetical protein